MLACGGAAARQWPACSRAPSICSDARCHLLGNRTMRTESRVVKHRATSPASRILSTVLVVLVGALLVEVLLEGWVQIRFADRSTNGSGAETVEPLGWPKNVKNGLYIALAALTALKITLDRRWRDFRTGADVAIVVLGVILTAAGIVGGSDAKLIGQALFVYFRGAIVFYALRAALPSQRQIRNLLATTAVFIAISAVIALIQMVVGRPAYTALGWVELKWADENRAQGLLTHPNHLGHVLVLTLLGLLSWLALRNSPTAKEHRRNVRYGWVATLVLLVALAASQSRESLVAFVVAAGIMWFVARTGGRKVIAAVVVLAVAVAAQLVARPSNWEKWRGRIAGAVDAVRVPSGAEETTAPAPAEPGPTPGPTTKAPAPTEKPKPPPAREIRVLYYQQGLELWSRRPLLGYGIGQFGGIVAHQNNPNWHLNPAFGPEGFRRYGATSTQVDSFWLHLLVEAGALGLAAYLMWLFLLILPLLARTPRFAGRSSRAPTAFFWGIGAVAVGFQVAFLAPSLEDPLFPPLLFTVLGLAWLARNQVGSTDEVASTSPVPAKEAA